MFRAGRQQDRFTRTENGAQQQERQYSRQTQGKGGKDEHFYLRTAALHSVPDDIVEVAVAGDVGLSLRAALIESPALQTLEPNLVRQLGHRVLGRVARMHVDRLRVKMKLSVERNLMNYFGFPKNARHGMAPVSYFSELGSRQHCHDNMAMFSGQI